MRVVASEVDRNLRRAELEAEAKKGEKEREENRKNKDFTQVYKAGWKRIAELSKGNPSAAGLYAFFAEHLDPGCGAVVCDQSFLADQFNVNTRTIRRWITYLEDCHAIAKIPVSGRVYAYALNPHEVWKGYDTSKRYAAFMTKTLVNKEGDIQRRLMSMFSKDTQQNLDLQ